MGLKGLRDVVVKKQDVLLQGPQDNLNVMLHEALTHVRKSVR
jgi:hypothetical protein